MHLSTDGSDDDLNGPSPVFAGCYWSVPGENERELPDAPGHRPSRTQVAFPHDHFISSSY